MEIIVTDERDERFIEFCNSFGCFLEEPQVVLLLMSFGYSNRHIQKIGLSFSRKQRRNSFQKRV